MLSDQRRAQLARIAENEARFDVMPDDVIRENRMLVAGKLSALPPLKSASEWACERQRLQDVSARQWAMLKSRIFVMRQRRAEWARDLTSLAHDRYRVQRRDAEWLLSEWQFTRGQIAACERALEGKAA